jgi:hypothetical protein
MRPTTQLVALTLVASAGLWFPLPAQAGGAVDTLGGISTAEEFLEAFEVLPTSSEGNIIQFRPDPARIVFEPPSTVPRVAAVLWRKRADVEGETLRADLTISRGGISKLPADGVWGYGFLTRIQENGRCVQVNFYLADTDSDGSADFWRILMFYDSETEPHLMVGTVFYDSRITPAEPGMFLAGKPFEMELRQSAGPDPDFELLIHVDGVVAVKSTPTRLTATSDYSKPGRAGLRWKEDGTDKLSVSTTHFWIGDQ